jgi:ABC-type bacteriocin/lantibiotic exporter with double-glycine peptidase domain
MKDDPPPPCGTEDDKRMNGLTQMFAYGWPLALAGFVIGVLAGGWTARRAAAREGAGEKAAPHAERLASLAAELEAARSLLEAEQAEAQEIDETLKELDEAVKRANGRLKLLSKALNPSA